MKVHLAIPLALALVLVALPGAAKAATPDPGACVGSMCPPGMLACVVGVAFWPDVCVTEPVVYCPPVTWFDETIGPLHVAIGGCGAHVELHEIDQLHVLP